MTAKQNKNYRGAGRPTQAQAKHRQQELLEKALDMFLKKGYTQTTLDSIATDLKMTKRTIYSAYGGKEALFIAAVDRAIEKNRTSLESLKQLESDSLEETLKRVAQARIHKMLSPDGIRLQRILNAEAFRFPGLIERVYRDSTGPTVEFLSTILLHHAEMGAIDAAEPEASAAIFLNMAVGTPARAALAGLLPGAFMSQESHVDYCVHLFLNGVIKR